jgi:hypothetical protein
MKMYERVSGGVAPPFLTSALEGGDWSASHPCCFTPRERAPGTHGIGCWVGPRAIVDTGVEKNLFLLQVVFPKFVKVVITKRCK